jgi:hypothetical protein
MKISPFVMAFVFQEHSFEVSLFAELFNEMLMRDFGFRIYRALNDAPERAKEDEKVIYAFTFTATESHMHV